MRNLRLVLVLFLGILTAGTAVGQMTKAEKKAAKKERKEWKKRKKTMSIDDFRALIEEQVQLKASNAAAVSDIESLEGQVANKDTQIGDLQKQVTRMQAAYQAAQRELDNLKENPPQQPVYNPDLVNGEDFSVGVVFKVQVGAFRKMDLQKYANTSNQFAEEDADDLRKYVIGNFRNYEDANVLKRYLREMGVDDAWIVPYRDGRRVPLREVVSDVKKTN